MDETEESRSDTSSSFDNESDGNQNVEATDPVSIAKNAGARLSEPRFLLSEKFIPTKTRIKKEEPV